MGVVNNEQLLKRPNVEVPAGAYTRKQQRVALVGVFFGLLVWAASGTDLLQDYGAADYAWVLPWVAIAFTVWLPLAQALQWLRTGKVQSGAITVLLAGGAMALGTLNDAALLLIIWTLTAVVRARVYELATAPLTTWSILAQGQWPHGRRAAVASAKKKGLQSSGGSTEGELLTVPSGSVIPCDGVVEGTPGFISSLWEELPAMGKEPGDLVYAGDVNLGDTLTVRSVRCGTDSALARAIDAGRASMVPVIRRGRAMRTLQIWSLWWSMAAVAAAAGLPFLLGMSTHGALTRSLALLALALPGAWGAATELPAVAAAGAALRRGLVPTTGWVMEHIGRIGMVVLVWDVTFDRRRRLVADVLPIKPKACTPMELLTIAAAVEVAAATEDPIAQAIQRAAEQEGLTLPTASNGYRKAGMGASAMIDGHVCLVGNERFMRENRIDTTSAAKFEAQLRSEECQPVFCSAGGYLLGALGVSEPSRQEWPRIAKQFRDLGVNLVVMNGNPEDGRSAWAPGHPEGMVSLLAGQEIPTLRSWGKARSYVGIAGDAGRDEDVFTQADVAIAMGPAAVEGSRHIIFLKHHINDLPWAIHLGRCLNRRALSLEIVAIISRVGLAGLVLVTGISAMQVVAVDAMMMAVMVVGSLGLLGKEKAPLPHRGTAQAGRRSQGKHSDH